jgi:prefoldin subunit 5
MKHAIEILEREKYKLESSIKSCDTMRKDMKEAQHRFQQITELKQAIKFIKSKQRVISNLC